LASHERAFTTTWGKGEAECIWNGLIQG